MTANRNNTLQYPFTAIVGQEEFKRALILSVIDPTIGGVLAVGDRGAGKTTLIRSLAQLMDHQEIPYPFVNLPIGASEDRLLGHVNLEKLINDKLEQVQPGLLAKANNGILYVDEINLLNDYLMDILLDASTSGHYYLEREGLSKRFESKFVLIGSMNPEEGELRPQLKDRFGFCVEVKASTSKEERVQIIKNRMQFDHDPKSFTDTHEQALIDLRNRILTAREHLIKVKVSNENLNDSVSLALEHQVEGMRADVLLTKAARAWAAFEGRIEIDKEDIELIAPLVLKHRSNKQDHKKQTVPPQPDEHQSQNGGNGQKKEQNMPGFEPLTPAASLETKLPGRSTKTGNHGTKAFGTSLKTVDKTAKEKIDIGKTVSQYVATDKFKLHKKHETVKATPKLIFLIDASGSMTKDKAIAYAKGLVNKTLEQQKSTETAIIAIHHSQAEVLLNFSKDPKVITDALEQLPIGGKTNIIAGIEQLEQLTQAGQGQTTQLVIITDGRFNTGAESNVFEESVKACQNTLRKYGSVVIVDSEQGTVRLGLAKAFANQTGANYQTLNDTHQMTTNI